MEERSDAAWHDRSAAIREVLATDVEAAFQGDPATRWREEIVLAYPGLQAIAVERLAHVLYEQDVPSCRA